ncbi:MAG TPA: alpha/beta hydrolase [Macromonas sp.]|nr:alpha/beta hydrolase [Macromonas sp.]
MTQIAPTPLLVFAHANGFPAGTYGVLFEQLQQLGYQVRALDKFGHDPRYPVSDRWTHLIKHLAEFTAQAAEQHNGPIYLVGHSMGGILSLVCAALHPELGGQPVKGVVMLDSPGVLGWRAAVLALAKHTPWIDRLTPARFSRHRRDTWHSAEEAHANFARKPLFAQWHPQALSDYIEHGTHEVDTPNGKRRVLSFRREVEVNIFNTLPHDLGGLLRRHPPACPVAYVAAEESELFERFGQQLATRLRMHHHPHRLQTVPGTHLFPLEHPTLAAQAIDRALRSFTPG